jgi:ABC-2 type transport system permease protein
VSSPFLTQFASLARRSVIRTLRQPAAIVPALLFPLIFLAVSSAGASSAASIPGFPADSYFEFVLAGTFVQGMMLAGVLSGSDLAVDVETGFLNRLSLTPMRGAAVLVGHIVGALTVGFIQGVTFIIVGLVFGASLASGIGGMFVLLALSLLVSLAFASLGSFVALRTGSSEAVQGVFPLFFILIGFSSFFLPRELLAAGWFKTIATYNPASYLIEGLRSLIITGWDGRALLLALVMGAGITFVGISASVAALRTRLVRS